MVAVGDFGQGLPALDRDRLRATFHRRRAADHRRRPLYPRSAGRESTPQHHKPRPGPKTAPRANTNCHLPPARPPTRKTSPIWYAKAELCQALVRIQGVPPPATAPTAAANAIDLSPSVQIHSDDSVVDVGPVYLEKPPHTGEACPWQGTGGRCPSWK